jgi:hypothetical protein
MRHDPGLAASPRVRYNLKMEGSGRVRRRHRREVRPLLRSSMVIIAGLARDNRCGRAGNPAHARRPPRLLVIIAPTGVRAVFSLIVLILVLIYKAAMTLFRFIRFSYWQVWLTAAATLFSMTAVARPATADTGVTCTYTVTTTGIGWFNANVDIANNGATINGWTLQWTFLTPTSLGSIWSANLTEQDGGRAVATNASWNGIIRTGQVTSFGWTASAASTAVPTDLTINGQPC